MKIIKILISLIALFAISASSVCAANLAVAPSTTNYDNLIAATNAQWKITVTTTELLNTGDIFQFYVPNIPNAQPFMTENATFTTSTGILLYSSLATGTAPSIGTGGGGPNQPPIIYGFVSGTVATGTNFTITIGGITNGAGQLSNMSNLSWNVKAGTASSSPYGAFAGANKFNATATASIVRAGMALASDENSTISITTATTSATSSITMSITASTSIPIGGKIVMVVPSEFSLANISIADQNINTSTPAATIASTTFSTSTSYSKNRIIMTVGATSTIAGQKITIVVGGFTNPATAAVYRPFYLYTAKSNEGVIDGSYNGFESSDYGGGRPPPRDSIHIGGQNTLNVLVKKDTGTTTAILNATERAQVKVVTGCPDKQFFVGEQWLNDSSMATYDKILDCNYMVGTEPFSKASSTFYDLFLPPSMKQINVVNGQVVTTTITFGMPDATATIALTGGVTGQNAFINAYSDTYQSFSPVFTDTSYGTQGFDAQGRGYAILRVKGGQTWNFSVQGGSFGSAANFTDSDGFKYWSPIIPNTVIAAGTTTNLGSFAYVQANKTLNVSLVKSGGSDPVTDSCVGVKRSGGLIFMGPQDQICSPNSGNNYQFKVPAGSIIAQVMSRGNQSDYPIAITATTTNKTIYLSSPTSYISVSVSSSAGTAINGAPVFAHGSNGFGNSQTGSGGTTTIYVSPGTYVVEGFAPAFGQLTAQTVTVTNSSNPSVAFTVNTGSLKTISGIVTMGGTAVAGAKIGARGTGSTTGGNGTETGSDGTYTLYVPAGTYSVGGWSPDTGGLDPQNADASSANVASVNWALGGQGTLRIIVNNAFNVSPLFGGAMSTTTGKGNGTDIWTASGTAKVADIKLAAGVYEVHVGSPMIGEITSLGDAATITAGATTTKTYNAAASSSLVTLSGSVTSSSVPVENVTIWASRINGPGFFSTSTNASGTYYLKVPDSRSYRVGAKILGYVASQGDVQVDVSGNTTQNFTLTSAGSTISGTVVNSSATAISDAWVSAKKTTASGTEVWSGSPTDASGNYSLNVDSGTDWILYAEGPCYFRSTGTSATAGDSGKTITLSAMSNCAVPTPEVRGITAASGGQIAKSDITLDIPANALGTGQSTVSVSVGNAGTVVSTPNATPLAGSVKSITASDSSGSAISSLNSNVTVAISYSTSDLPVGFNESNLQMGYFDSATMQWVPVACTVDTVNHTVSAQVSHFTDYGPILPGVPEAPAGLSASAASASQINLTWSSVAEADYYVLYRSLTDSAFTTSIGTTTVSSYSDTGLSASTAYYYKVAGYNENGEGANSSSTNATTQAVTATTTGVLGNIGGGSVSGSSNTKTTLTSQESANSQLISQLLAQIQTLQMQIQQLQIKKGLIPPGRVVGNFKKYLKYGVFDPEVTTLQLKLKKLGYFSYSNATGYYGNGTKMSVIKFQRANGIDPTGTVGPKTRAALNNISD